MSIKRNSDIPEIVGREGSKIKNYFDPNNTDEKIRFSIAHFMIQKEKRTLLHRMKASEIYYILEGIGMLKIDGKSFTVKKDDSIFVPPMSEQSIENIGDKDLRFLCIVDPAWNQENEIVLE